MAGFIPNPHAIRDALDNLASPRGGGIPTHDDMRFVANQKKWERAPLVGDFEPSNEFIFWQAVHDAIGK